MKNFLSVIQSIIETIIETLFCFSENFEAKAEKTEKTGGSIWKQLEAMQYLRRDCCLCLIRLRLLCTGTNLGAV